MSKTETLEKLLSFAFVMSENMVGLTKGNYDEATFIKKTYAYLHKYNIDSKSKLELEKALQRLEAIDNANPSEALQGVDILYANAMDLTSENTKYLPEYLKPIKDKIKQSLIKAQEQEKALKIVFEKTANILLLELAENVDEYNERIVPNGQLTQEEFESLKRYVNENR